MQPTHLPSHSNLLSVTEKASITYAVSSATPHN